MLSRSSYNNGANHLRRAKSTPCVQRRTSSSSLIDPVAAKQHAIVAATLAYERSHRGDIADGRSKEPARRRSHRAGRSEGQGSHFEASHAPRRQSSKRLSTTTSSSNDHSRSRRATVSSILPSKQAFRPQYVNVTDCSNNTTEESFREVESTLNIHRVRKSKSMLAPFDLGLATSIDAISFDVSSPHSVLKPVMRCTDETTTCILGRDILGDHDIPQVPPMPLTHNTIYKVDERVAKARDHHLQQFHMQKFRHRASSLLTPFKKRVESNEPAPPLSGNSNNGVTYGSGRSSPAPAPEIRPLQGKATRELRQSQSLKEKIRRVFRKPSSLQIGLPVQQVEASRAHFGDLLMPSTKVSTIRAKTPNIFSYSMAGSPRPSSVAPVVHPGSKEKAQPYTYPASETTTTTSTSRVTSWADSTIEGTTISQGSNPLAIIHEDSQQPEISSASARKRASLSLFRRVTKHHPVNLENMKPSLGVDTNEFSVENASKHAYQIRVPSLTRNPSAIHDTLPSQVRRSSLNSSRAGDMIRATLRVVSSGSHSTASFGSNKHRKASTSTIALPVLKSNDMHKENRTSEPPSLSPAFGWREQRERNRLQKVQTETNQIAPSGEQTATQAENSRDRRTQSLDECQSLSFPESLQHMSTELNYCTTDREKFKAATDAICTSTENIRMVVWEPSTFRSRGVMSPSLYSRNTNSASPKRRLHDSAVSLKSTSSNDTGTAVITASRPVVKYSVGSSKKHEPHLAKTSRDWHNWISDQVHDLETPPPEDLTLSSEYVCRTINSGHRREHAQIVDGEDVSIGSIPVDSIEIYPNEQRPTEQWLKEPRSNSSFDPSDRPSSRLHDRPGLKSRSASCMNERFPLINTGRPSFRKLSPPLDNVQSQRVKNLTKMGKDEENLCPPSSGLTIPIIKTSVHTVLRRPQSTNSFHHSRTSLAHYTTSEVDSRSQAKSTSRIQTEHTKIPVTPLGDPPKRPKSALDIRAARRNRISPTPTPNIDTDPTLAAIFKGPYYDDTASPKPISIGKSTSFYKENSPFPRDNSSPVRTIRNGDNSSILLPSTPTSGQRLAEQFLTARKLRSEMQPSVSSSTFGSPAFL
jgi:hypothetical protein